MTTRYSDDEVKEILRRALERQDLDADGIEHEDLVAAAREVGIDAELLERAAIETRLDREARDVVLAERSRKRRRWVKGLGTYAVVNGFLFLIDMMTAGGPWFMWPLVGWGLLVALQGLRVLPPPSRAAEQELIAKEKSRILRRREKERARRAKEAKRASRKSVEGAFESVVEEGVAALLSAIAGQIDKAARAADPALAQQTNFDRYVQNKKGGATAPTAPTGAVHVTPPPNAPRARVAADPQGSDPKNDKDLEAEQRDGAPTHNKARRSRA